MGYVAHQLRHPFAHVHGRLVAEVNGIGVDFTEEVRVVPGSTRGHGDRREDARDVDGMGVASLSVDKAGLINLLSMSGEEADALSDWMRNRVESDLAIACDRIGVAHVSSLLRSPDVVRLLVESGSPLENPATGERMARDPETGEVECDFSTGASWADTQEEDEAALMDWYCLRVSSDDRWRVDWDVALHIAHDKEGPWAELRETARAAYLADPWLTTRERVEAIPTRERMQDLLAREDPTEVRRGYRVREECASSDVRPPGEGSPVPSTERVV